MPRASLTALVRAVWPSLMCRLRSGLPSYPICAELNQMAQSQNHLDSITNAPLSMFDDVLTNALRSFHWAKDPLVMEPDSVKDRLGIYHFAAPRQDTVSYNERVMAGRTILRQETIGEDKSKLDRKATELYRHGRFATSFDIQTMVANFWLFGKFAIKDFDGNPTAIWGEISNFVSALKFPKGQHWTGLHTACPHVFFHMVNDLENMITPFVTIAQNFQYRSEARKGNPIAVAAYDDAIMFARHQVMRLNNILMSGDLATTETRHQS